MHDAFLQLAEGELIYVSVNAQRSKILQDKNDDKVLVIDNCFVTSSRDYLPDSEGHIPLMLLIENKYGFRRNTQRKSLYSLFRCPANVFVSVLSNGESKHGHFSVRVFGWNTKRTDMDKFYIHCTVTFVIILV